MELIITENYFILPDNSQNKECSLPNSLDCLEYLKEINSINSDLLSPSIKDLITEISIEGKGISIGIKEEDKESLEDKKETISLYDKVRKTLRW